MKKTVLGVFIVSLALGLTACGEKQGGSSVSSNPREQVVNALAEITGARTNIQVAVMEGKIPTFSGNYDEKTHLFIGIGDGTAALEADSIQTKYCLARRVFRSDVAAIGCELGKGTEKLDSSLDGKHIALVRDAQTGNWACLADLGDELLPAGCSYQP